MSTVDAQGMMNDARVTARRYATIEHGTLDAVRAIVLHQTDSQNAEPALAAYRTGPNGAHFLIDADGAVYQTTSLRRRCYHVGRLIRSRCLEIERSQCKDPELAKAKALGWTAQIKEIDRIERQKEYPARYPVNADAIGIELVGRHLDDSRYEAITTAQQVSLTWLIGELYLHFGIGAGDVFRHPEVSYKNPGEAAGATWE